MADLHSRIHSYLKHIKDHGMYINNNHEKLNVFEGELLPQVFSIMEATLSSNYFDRIKHRYPLH